MAAVELRLPCSTEYVRTVRMVAAIVARQGSLTQSQVDDVRSAVSEACTYLVRHSSEVGAMQIDITDACDPSVLSRGSLATKRSFQVCVIGPARGAPQGTVVEGQRLDHVTINRMTTLADVVEVNQSETETRVRLVWLVSTT